jgi:hypothetical protein
MPAAFDASAAAGTISPTIEAGIADEAQRRVARRPRPLQPAQELIDGTDHGGREPMRGRYPDPLANLFAINEKELEASAPERIKDRIATRHLGSIRHITDSPGKAEERTLRLRGVVAKQ